MFKLIKILNTGVNVPEPELLPCETNVALDAGSCVVYNNSNNIIRACDHTSPPTHILVKDVKKGDAFALCYRVSSEMIFEVPLIGSPANVRIGMDAEFIIKDGHGAYAIGDNDGGAAIIYSLEGAKKSGDKVLVTFNV